MVIAMQTWMSKYINRDEFLTWFLDEQEYVDAMFVQIVMFNFGEWINTNDLPTDVDLPLDYLGRGETADME